jgi:hypothetical protein
MKLIPTNDKVKIEIFVYAGDEKIRHTSNMRGEWGYDFKCSCGFETKTGGAIYSYIREQIKDHKIYDHGYERTYNAYSVMEAK